VRENADPVVQRDRLHDPAEQKNRVVFIDIGRALAAVLVFYTHVDVLFLEKEYGGTWFTNAANNVFGLSLGLGPEGLGAVAVPFFFLVSGFVVTPVALKLGSGRFSVNRLFRIYPLLIVAVLVSAAAVWFGLRPLIAGTQPDVSIETLITNTTLANFLIKPFGAFVGVAWTLAVELIFYGVLVATLPLLRRWVWLAIAVEVEFVLLAVLVRDEIGGSYGVFASQAAYLLIPIMGQVLWAGWNRKIPSWLAGGYLAITWAIFVWAADLKLDEDYILRPTPIAYAVLLFLVGLGLEPRLRQRASWTAMSERSYSLYLMHGVIAFPIMHALVDVLPLWFVLLIGIGATIAVVHLSYLFIERPTHNLSRRLSKRRVRQEPAEPAEQPSNDPPTVRHAPVAPPAPRHRRPPRDPNPARPPRPATEVAGNAAADQYLRRTPARVPRAADYRDAPPIKRGAARRDS
jgi:peptidoglycan/LPS O-acetylase OafA/YrhL